MPARKNAKFVCYNDVIVSWIFNGGNLPHNAMFTDGAYKTLLLLSINSSNSGIYECISWNEHNEESHARGKLKVMCKSLK